MDNYEALCKACEEDIRAGHLGRAAKRMAAINLVQVPRSWRLPLANICRRSELITLGLKLLTPITMASERKLNLTPTLEELAEYAILLQRNGSVNEAIDILDRIPPETIPSALLYRSFCHFNKWEYAQAVPHLRRYLEFPLATYPQLLGRINLAAALAMTRQHKAAMPILEATLKDTRTGSFARLQANCLELTAQIHIQEENYTQAEIHLEQAAGLLRNSRAYDTLFIRKWQTVIGAHRSGHTTAFENLKREAKELRIWETYREADLLSLKAKFDEPLFRHLVYGTPFLAYRQRIETELGSRDFESHGLFGDPKAPSFDIESGRIDGVEEGLKPGSKVHQALAALLKDFYRPLGVGGLYAELFPGEHFNIYSSPDRVHQILRRTRKWLEASNLPIALLESKSRYRLEIGAGLALRVPLSWPQIDWHEIQFRKLKQNLAQGQTLSGAEISRRLEFTEAEYKRFLKWTLEHGRLIRVSGGGHSAYTLPHLSQSDKVAA